MSKLIKALYNALKKKTKRKEDDAAVLYGGFRGFFHYFPALHSRTGTNSGDDTQSDTRSTLSCSTNATADDNPGTGRLVDKFFFQPVGRSIERLAMRFTISSLNPAQILRYIESDRSFRYFPLVHLPEPLNDAIVTLSCQRGLTYIVGLKSLVKQTQYVPL